MDLFVWAGSKSFRRSNMCHACLQQLRYQPQRSNRNYHFATISHQYRNSTRRNSYHTTPPCRQRDTNTDTQAHPLGDFYADLLAKPIPSESTATTSLPTFVTTGGDESREARAAKLFGNIKGSGYERRTSTTPDATWQTVNGVPIPPRPSEPDNCCMSGCVHCVWDDYRDDIEEWATRLKVVQAKAVGDPATKTPKVQMPRAEVDESSTSMDDDGGGSESLWQAPPKNADADELFAGIPVGIREFMNIEKKIRERKKQRMAKGS